MKITLKKYIKTLFLYCVFILLLILSSHTIRTLHDISRFQNKPLSSLNNIKYCFEFKYFNEYWKNQLVFTFRNLLTRRKKTYQGIELKFSADYLKTFSKKYSYNKKFPYEKGLLKYGNFWKEVKIKPRGKNPTHWITDFPSLRIKLKKNDSFFSLRRLNLINPRSPLGLENLFGNKIGKDLNLLTPFMANSSLSVNGKDHGVILITSQLDESWMRKLKIYPSTVYVGEKHGIWENAGLWKEYGEVKLSSRFSKHFEDFIQLLDYIWKHPGEKINFNKLAEFYNYKEFIKLMALENFCGSVHQDKFHNWRLYYDPSSGKIRPVVWDTNGHGEAVPADYADLTAPLIHPYFPIVLNPDWYYLKNKILYELLSELAFTDDLIKEMDIKEIADFIYSTPSTNMVTWWSVNGNDLYSLFEVEISRKDALIQVLSKASYIQERVSVLKKKMETVDMEVYYNEFYDQILLAYSGESPVELKNIFAHNITGKFTRGYADKVSPISEYYPSDNFDDSESVIIYPAFKIYNSATHFSDRAAKLDRRYCIIKDIKKLKNLDFNSKECCIKNLISNENISIPVKFINKAQFNDLIHENKTNIVFPELNKFDFNKPKKENVIISAGSHIISEDLIIDNKQDLIIEAGAELLINEDVSIISRGNLFIKGTEEKPVIIKTINNDQFNSFFVNGNNSNEVMINYLEFSNGSEIKNQSSIVSGSLALHNCKKVKIMNSLFSNNIISDDLVNIKSCPDVFIEKCRFFNGNADLLDLDYCRGNIIDSEFYNAGNDAVDMMGSIITISNSSFEKINDKAVSVGENSTLLITKNSYKAVNEAITVKDSSVAYCTNNSFNEAKININAKQKSSYYGGGGVVFTDNLDNNISDHKSLIINSEPEWGRITDSISDTEHLLWLYKAFKEFDAKDI